MFDYSPSTMSTSARTLRADMISMIAVLSQSHTQEALNSDVMIDFNTEGSIVGMDMSALSGTPCMCDSTKSLGSLTTQSWITMHVP